MAPSSKNTAPAKDKDRRKSAAGRDSKIVTLKTSADRLRTILDPSYQPVKEDSSMKDVKESPSESSTPQPPAASNADNASDSNPATPANGGTPAPSVMGPPGEGQGPKKKGVKRSAPATNGDGVPKARGKPGPKKRQRMEDGSLEPSRINAHRLGPKANQGAINAGLRALDRSGKPCRKWGKGNFQLKTFTGVQWEVRRWTAPPKPKPVESNVEPGSAPASGPVSATGSSKENKENSVEQPANSENSNSGGDVEMRSVPSIQASSPAPMPVAAGA